MRLTAFALLAVGMSTVHATEAYLSSLSQNPSISSKIILNSMYARKIVRARPGGRATTGWARVNRTQTDPKTISDSIYFDNFEDFLNENDVLEVFEITSTLGRFTSDSPARVFPRPSSNRAPDFVCERDPSSAMSSVRMTSSIAQTRPGRRKLQEKPSFSVAQTPGEALVLPKGPASVCMPAV